jgi:hypothetical protein
LRCLTRSNTVISPEVNKIHCPHSAD